MKTTKISLILFLLLALGSVCACQRKAGEPKVVNTEDAYLGALKVLDAKKKEIYILKWPAKEENRLIHELNEERRRLAVLHAASSPSAMSTVITESSNISRDDLHQVYASLNKGMQRTNLGKALRKHIEKKTLLVGDPLPHFNGVGLDGQPFDWSVTDGKRVLLIYEGWGWIKRDTHLWFKDLLAATDRDSLAVVAYVYAASLAEFQKRVKSFQLEPYLVVSDLQGKEGPLNKKIGIRGVPTYFYTDRQGRVRRIIRGFDAEAFSYLTGLSPEWGENWLEE